MAHNRRLGPHYKDMYEQLKLASVFLNPRAREHSLNHAGWHIADRDQLASLLKVREEVIINSRKAVAAIQDRFKATSEAAVREGRRPLKQMPPDLREQWEWACARLDIAKEERDEVRKVLQKAEEVQEQQSDAAVLQYGPMGTGKLLGGILARIDGQLVEADDEGVLRIADKRSPYNGMAVTDYRDAIVKPWRRAQAKAEHIAHKGYKASQYQARLVTGEAEEGTYRHPKVPWPSWPKHIPRSDQPEEPVLRRGKPRQAAVQGA